MSVEAENWRQIVEGNKQAFSEVYVVFFKKLYNYGRKFTDDDTVIEDAIQESMLSLWDRKEKLNEVSFPVTYIYSSFRYLLFAQLRQIKKRSLISTVNNDPEFSADYMIIQSEEDISRQAQLQSAIAKLTSRQREAIFLRFYEGLSYEEVAATLGISVKATYKIMARAILELKSQLSTSTFIILTILQYSLGK